LPLLKEFSVFVATLCPGSYTVCHPHTPVISIGGEVNIPIKASTEVATANAENAFYGHTPQVLSTISNVKSM